MGLERSPEVPPQRLYRPSLLQRNVPHARLIPTHMKTTAMTVPCVSCSSQSRWLSPWAVRPQYLKAGTSSCNSYQQFPADVAAEKPHWAMKRDEKNHGWLHTLKCWQASKVMAPTHAYTCTHTQGQTGVGTELIDCPQSMEILFKCYPFHLRIIRVQSTAYWQLQQSGKK